MAFTRTFTARTDSGSANNPALNLTGDPAISMTFVNETSSGGTGDLIFDKPGGGVDPDTQIVIDGVSYSFRFEVSGTLPTTKSDGSQQVPDQFEGDPVYIVTVIGYPAPGSNTRLAFLPDSSATLAEMDDFGNGAIDVQGVSTTPTGEAVCFAKGVLILTDKGEVPVEALKENDLVMTIDGTLQPIIWISSTNHNWGSAPHKDKPILIPAGALGQDCPTRDLQVSPQHKLLLTGPKVVAFFGKPEVLVPAIGVVALPGVRQMHGKQEMTYYHILLPAHGIICANGTHTESFYPGPMAMRAVGAQARRKLTRSIAMLKVTTGKDYGPLARFATTKQTSLKFLRQIDSSSKNAKVAA